MCLPKVNSHENVISRFDINKKKLVLTAKVQPTRQLPPTAQVVSQAASHTVVTPATTQASHDLATGAAREGQPGAAQSSLPTTIQQGSIFLSQAHRGSPNVPTTAITMATTHSDGRATDRLVSEKKLMVSQKCFRFSLNLIMYTIESINQTTVHKFFRKSTYIFV